MLTLELPATTGVKNRSTARLVLRDVLSDSLSASSALDFQTVMVEDELSAEIVHPTLTLVDGTDPTIDPDYSNWGSSPAGIAYTGLIAYLIKSNQEQEEKIVQTEQALQQERDRITQLETVVSQQNTLFQDLLARVTALEQSLEQ